MAPASKSIPYPCVECKTNCGRAKGEGEILNAMFVNAGFIQSVQMFPLKF